MKLCIAAMVLRTSKHQTLKDKAIQQTGAQKLNRKKTRMNLTTHSFALFSLHGLIRFDSNKKMKQIGLKQNILMKIYKGTISPSKTTEVLVKRWCGAVDFRMIV